MLHYHDSSSMGEMYSLSSQDCLHGHWFHDTVQAPCLLGSGRQVLWLPGPSPSIKIPPRSMKIWVTCDCSRKSDRKPSWRYVCTEALVQCATRSVLAWILANPNWLHKQISTKWQQHASCTTMHEQHIQFQWSIWDETLSTTWAAALASSGRVYLCLDLQFVP